MPKGSKKRKAVKKKAHHHHNPNHHDDASHSSHNNTYAMQGDEDLKQHEDKESDSESVNSPTSQDNPNSQLDLTDGEKEERKKVDDTSHTRSSSEDGQSLDESKVHPELVPIADEEGGVHVDQELKLADQSNGMAENVEIVSTNSELFQRQDEGCADSYVTGADELKDDNSTAMVVEPIKESGDIYLEKSSSDEEALVIEKLAVSVEDAPLINPDEAVSSLSEGAPPATDAVLVGEKSSIIEENGLVTEVDKVALPDEKTNGDDIASSASVMIPDVTVPGMMENKEKEAILLDKNYLASDPVNLASENKGDDVVSKTDVVAPSDPKFSTSPLITEGNVMLPKNAPRTEAGHHVDSMDRSAEQKNDIEVSESSVSQPLLAARPQPRTSWMSCCGLFEVFGGSNR